MRHRGRRSAAAAAALTLAMGQLLIGTPASAAPIPIQLLTINDFHGRIEQLIRELEGLVPSAARVRGEARATVVATLARLDMELVEAAVAQLENGRRSRLREEAGEELAPFGSRMPAEAKARALEAAFERLAREAAGLPDLRYE